MSDSKKGKVKAKVEADVKKVGAEFKTVGKDIKADVGKLKKKK